MMALRLIDRALGAVTAAGVIVTMAAMSIVIVLQVYFRYIASSPLPWSEEAARYLMVWLVFLGAPAALRTGQHVGVTIFRDMSPRLLRLILTVVGEVIVLTLLAYVVYHGYQVTVRNLMQSSPALRIPIGWVTAAVPIGSALMMIEIVKSLVANVHALVDRQRPIPRAEAHTPGLDDPGAPAHPGHQTS